MNDVIKEETEKVENFKEHHRKQRYWKGESDAVKKKENH